VHTSQVAHLLEHVVKSGSFEEINGQVVLVASD